MSMTPKVIKKGEVLFKDGDKIQNVVFIQSGSVNQCLFKNKKTIDFFQLGTNQVLAENALLGQAQHLTGAVATVETKIIEVPPDVLKQQIEAAPSMMKMLIKSLLERLRQTTTEIKSTKVSTDASPCADEFIPQVYSAMYFTALHKGEKDPKTGKTTVDWQMMRSYSQRVLGQSPKRLEGAAQILVKLQLAQFEMGKLPEDPDGPDVITKIIINDLGVVESFFEFYQYYLYKPGKKDLIKYDDFCTQLLEIFVHEGKQVEPDRFGIVAVDFTKCAAVVKEKMALQLGNDHFTRLETKGVLCKRRSIEGVGVKIEFEIKEYTHLLFSWNIIRELEKWNERGFIDMTEKLERKPKKTGPSCPQCNADVVPQAKFCQDCGAKLAGTQTAA